MSSMGGSGVGVEQVRSGPGENQSAQPQQGMTYSYPGMTSGQTAFSPGQTPARGQSSSQSQSQNRPNTNAPPQRMTFQIPQSAYAAPLLPPNSGVGRYISPSEPLAYTPPQTSSTPLSGFSEGTDAEEEDFLPNGEDPMWAEEMFDGDVEVMGEEEMGGGMMVGSNDAGSGQWRGGQPTSPGTSPSQTTLHLPLSSDSPAIPNRGDDFGTINTLPASSSASTYGSSYDPNALHNLLPTLGVTQMEGQSPSTGSIQSMPRAIPQQQGARGTDNTYGPMASSASSYNQTLGQAPGAGQVHAPSSPHSSSGSLPKSAIPTPPHYALSNVPSGSSPPDLRRQAGISAALASSNRNNPGASPTLSMSPGTSVQRPSPLGQHYLAQNDPQHISKQPMGSIQFGAMHQPLFPTMAPLRNPTEASPTLSMEPEEKLSDYDAFGDRQYGNQALFPTMSMVTGNKQMQSGQKLGLIQPHQAPLPPSPAMGYYSASATPPIRTSQDFGSPSVRVNRTFEEPSMAPTRPRMRQTTDDSFASTSSEEEDISSPMILGDVQMGRKSVASPLMGVSPRANVSTGFSPRSTASGSLSTGGGPSKSMFPDLRKVHDLAKMRSPIPAGATGTGPTFGRTSFSFQPGKNAPVFPPMSASSSSSDGFDDSDDDTMAGGGSDESRLGRKYAPRGRAQRGEAVDGGDGRNGRGGGYRDSDERPPMPRSASITVGGSGYSEAHFRGDGGNGGDDSDGEPPRPPGRDPRGRLEAVPVKKSKTKLSRSRSKTRATETAESDIVPVDPQLERDLPPDTELGDADGDEGADADDDDEEEGSDEDDGGDDFKSKKRKSTGKAAGSSEAKAKRRKSTVQEQGNVTCDYVDPLPPYEKCDSRFHRVYDEQRHQATIHARDEGRAVRAGKLKEEDAKLWIQYGRPQVDWICSCGQVFSRRDALMRHRGAKKHQ